MRNKLENLNNHLFAQMERLNEEGISEKNLKKEIERAKAMNSVAKQLVDNARVTLDSSKFFQGQLGLNKLTIPEQFQIKGDC